MILLGIDDIRELFTKDPDKLKEYYSRWVRYRRTTGTTGSKYTY